MFCFAVGQSIIVPAVDDLSVALGAPIEIVGWAMTGNLLATALATGLLGRLGDLYGRRRMLVVSLVLALIGNLIALVPVLEMVIAGRVVQGLGGGMFALSFGIVRAHAPIERRAGLIGLLGAATGFGGIVGIPVGSFMIGVGDYQWMFVGGVATAVASVVLVLLKCPRDVDREAPAVNWVGSVGLAAAVTLLLLVVSEAHVWGVGDARTWALPAVGVVGLVALVRRERGLANPLLDVVVLRHREVALAGISAFVVGGAFYAILFLVPRLARAPVADGGLGIDGIQTGLILLPGCVLMTATGFLAGRVIGRLGGRRTLASGSAVSLAGLVLLAALPPAVLVAVATAVACVGVGLVIAALPNIIIEVVPECRTSESTGVNSLFRIVGSAVGAQICIALATGSTRAAAGFVASFVVMAVAMALVAAAAIAIPRSAS
ncbi:MAG: hypothetical protein ABS81_11025 [Pseudonocardia sp. SCN 72-86]|nr:MAG: hypothetical protein ABS81_11025 [Pseudonocardia sp. SCN 72-86]